MQKNLVTTFRFERNGINIHELKFMKSIYPRHRDLRNGNKIKPDMENVRKIMDAIGTKSICHKITYNTRTMHIIDGNHLWVAFKKLKYKVVPNEYLNPVTIEPKLEMWVGAKMNYTHGLALTRRELRAVLRTYWDENSGRMKYGCLKQFAEDFSIPYETLRYWVRGFNAQKQDSMNSPNSNRNDGRYTNAISSKFDIMTGARLQLAQLQGRLEIVEQERDEYRMKWENHIKECPMFNWK